MSVRFLRLSIQIRRSGRLGLLTLALCAFCSSRATAQGQPVISRVQPFGVQPGTTVEMQLSGQNLAQGTQFWTSCGATAERIDDVAQNDAAKFRLTVPSTAPRGLHAARIVTPSGLSPLRLFMVDSLLSVAETGGNNSRDAAQEIPVPAGVDGNVDNLARDFFRFSVEAGQSLTFDVHARRIGSPLDPVLQLYTASGRLIASADDTPGLAGDCLLSHQFTEAGVYTIEVRDIRFGGSGDHVYRLRIGDFPAVTSCLPIGLTRGATTQVTPAGPGATTAPPVEVTVPADWQQDWYAVEFVSPTAAVPSGPAGAAGLVPTAIVYAQVSDAAEDRDQEPNNSVAEAQQVGNGSVSGLFNTRGDVDCFSVALNQGERLVLEGRTRQWGLPSDLSLRLLGPDGNQVAAVEDASETREGILEFQAPAEGRYVVEVKELFGRGGEGFTYRLARRPEPQPFSLHVDADALTLPAGGVGVLPVSVSRWSHGGDILLSVEGLPAGALADPARLGAGVNAAVITVQSPPDSALPLSAITVIGTASINGQEVRVPATLSNQLGARMNKPPLVPPALTNLLAAAGSPQPRLRLRTEPASITFGKELVAEVKVIAERGEGLDEAVELKLLPEAGSVPNEVKIELQPVPKGAGEIAVKFSGTENAPLGTFSVVFVGTLKQGEETVTASPPAITYTLAAPFSGTLTAAADKLPRNGELVVKLHVDRNPAFTGPITIQGKNLPAGVELPQATLAADQSDIDLILRANAEAALGPASGAAIVLTAESNAKLTGEIPAQVFMVE